MDLSLQIPLGSNTTLAYSHNGLINVAPNNINLPRITIEPVAYSTFGAVNGIISFSVSN